MLADTETATMLFQPVIRQAFQDFFWRIRPDMMGIQVEIARFAVSIIKPILEFTGGNPHAMFALSQANCVIGLSALAAEHHRQQHMFLITLRHKLLSIDGDIASIFMLQRSIDRITGADELMQPESEGWETRFG